MPTPLARPLVAAAAVAAFALTAPAFAQSCGDGCGTDADAPQAQFVAAEARPADEIVADMQAIELPDDFQTLSAEQQQATMEELQGKWMALADEFVAAYPEDERAAEMMYMTAQMADDAEAKKAGYQRLVEMHPDSPMAQQAKGELAKLEKVGQPFELTFEEAVTGEEISVQDDLAGKVVVIDFWATWCGPCVAELPHMKELYEQYKDQGVEFVGVSLDAPPSEGGRDALLKFVEERELPWPQYYQGNGWDSEFSKSWGINSIPAIFVVDASGKLHSTDARGKLDEMIPELIKQRDDAQASAE